MPWVEVEVEGDIKVNAISGNSVNKCIQIHYQSCDEKEGIDVSSIKMKYF